MMSGDITLQAGTDLKIVVGGQGVNGDFGTIWGGSGGGGSFVYTGAVPEPASAVLMALGLLAPIGIAWRRTRTTSPH